MMPSTEALTKLFAEEIRADPWCMDIIRIYGDDLSRAAERLKNWYRYFHDSGSIADKIVQLVTSELDWLTLVTEISSPGLNYSSSCDERCRGKWQTPDESSSSLA